jgi:CRP/FNR family transcriptional regulator, cyclic AMP receptor protein
MPTLDNVPLLQSLTPAERREFEAKCRWREFEPGRAVIDRGEQLNDVYVLVSGRAHVMNFSVQGRVIDYAALHPGDVFGELAAIDGLPRSASVVTQTPCLIAVIPGKVFMHLVTTNAHIALELFKRLASIIRRGDERIADFSLLGAEQRVCLELLRLAEPDPGANGRFVIHPFPTQSTFANGVGLARETVGRILSRLTRDKLIERHDKAMYVRDRDLLEERAMM